MASTAGYNQNHVLEGYGKSYGNTVVERGAHAQLGDISQNVHINGGLHFHIHPRLDELAAASCIVELLDVGSQLLQAGERLVEHLADSQGAEDLLDMILHLKRVQLQLCGHGASQSIAKPAQPERKNLHDVLNSAHQDAANILRLLEEVRAVLDRRPPRPPKPPQKLNEVEIDEFYKRTEVMLMKTIFNEWLLEMRQSFLRAWNDTDLKVQLESLSAYHKKLNMQLKVMLNTQSATPEAPEESNDIIEVLAMHQARRSGLESLAAIFTRKNGDSEAVTSVSLNANYRKPTHDMALIRYDIGDKNGDTEPLKGPLIGKATDFIKKIKAALFFREEDDRRIEVKEAHEMTFNWIFEPYDSFLAPHFRTWLESGSQCFWINGKAGSGKSTLMKFIAQHQILPTILKRWAGNRQLVLANFFFWYAGQPLQKSHEGVLRSLLYQILDTRPDLTPVIFPRLSRFMLCQSTSSDAAMVALSMQELQKALKLLIEKMPKDLAIFLMIDGVDEYAGDHLDFSKFLVTITNNSSFKLLVSSRPIPACTHVFSRFPSLRLQDLTAGDIRAYIEAELLQDPLLLEMDCLEPGIAREVEIALTEKASGVFLWIYLVVKALLKSLGEYDDRETLIKVIDALPSDLENLYDHMFGRMSKEHQQEGSLLLQLIVRANEAQQQPLTALQLYIADRCYHDNDAFPAAGQYSSGHEELLIKAIDGKLRSRCCGLVEVRYRDVRGPLKEPRVDYLHRTVYDYLRDPSVWQKVINVCGLTYDDIDFPLLVSAVQLLKRFALIWLFTSQPDICRRVYSELFAACLEYSYTITCIGNGRYMPFLQSADTIIRSLLPHSSASNATFYNSARQIFMSKREYYLPPEAKYFEEGSVLPITVTSMLTFAGLRFPAYFEFKVRTEVVDVATKSLLLLYVLALRVSSSLAPACAGVYSRNIQTLLQQGARPNVPTKRIFPGHIPLFLHRTATLGGVGSRELIPWNFWLYQRIETVGHLHITIQLLKSGACVASKNEEKKRLVDCLRRKLKYYRDNGTWPDDPEQAGSQEPLPRMTLPERQSTLGKRGMVNDQGHVLQHGLGLLERSPIGPPKDSLNMRFKRHKTSG